MKTTGSTSQYYGPCWERVQAQLAGETPRRVREDYLEGPYNDEETAAREYHAAVHRFGLQAIRRTSVDASGNLVPKPNARRRRRRRAI